MDARITALSASVDRLLALLSEADDTAVLIQLETAISDRQGELDSLTAQRRYLADQVTMSAVSLQISSEAPVPAATPSTFWDAVVAGAATLGSVATALVLFLGFALPWLAVIAVLLAIVWIVRRRRHRRAASPSPTADH
jgi:Flp pilus assembly protein TadB